MNERFEPCLSILPAAQRAIWPALAPIPKLGFVLYGGTAVALRLGHRASVDFDFFTDRSLDKNALMVALSFLQRSQFLQDQPDTLTIDIPGQIGASEHVKILFVGSIHFGRYAQPAMTSDGILQVAALDDLMATTLKVILQRVEAKDYADITAMNKADVALDRGLAIAQAMYGGHFQPAESLKALTYFEGGDLHTLSNDDKHTLIEAASAVRQLPRVTRSSSALAISIGH